MKKISYILLMFLLITLSASAQTPLKKVYNDTIDPMAQIDNALEKAKSENKFVVCQVGGNWCPWCLRFADFIEKDSTISKLISDNFVYTHISYDPRSSKGTDKADKAKNMLKRLGNPARFGFPVLVILDANGTVIHIQDSGYLEEGKGYNKEKVIRFFSNWTPKAVNQL